MLVRLYSPEHGGGLVKKYLVSYLLIATFLFVICCQRFLAQNKKKEI